MSGLPRRCWARAGPRSWNTGWNGSPRPGPAWSTPPTPSGAAWGGTCTTAPRRRGGRPTRPDGAQRRLLSRAMNLGVARAQTETVEEAHEAITEAHEEAKAAL